MLLFFRVAKLQRPAVCVCGGACSPILNCSVQPGATAAQWVVIRLSGVHNRSPTRGRVYACQVFFVFRLHLFTRWAQIVEQQHFEGEGFGEDPSPSGADSGNAKIFTPNEQYLSRLRVMGEGKKVETC